MPFPLPGGSQSADQLVKYLADPVRTMAAELVGAWAPTHPEAAAALQASAEADPSPVVRKKAAWYAPGGTIYRRKVAGATMTHGSRSV